MNQRIALGAPLVACVAAALLAGIAGGLLRVGIALPGASDAAWLARAAIAHAALMIGGFMGTVIAIERAVAAKQRAAWVGPVASGLGAIAFIAGAPQIGAVLLVLASALFVFVNALLLRRQTAPHTALLLASAVAWFVGNVLLLAQAPTGAVLPWWFAFLVITIAAERLEMTRLMRRRPGAQATLYLLLAALALGAALSAIVPLAGGVLYGASLLGLAAWLLTFDIARRTVHADGLSRYMALCLLGGYVWLAVSGVAWAATALGYAARDTALHALALGFVLSMIMGHAPVILPAVTRVKLHFSKLFYFPLAVLHLSLVLRLAGGAVSFDLRAHGALCNAIAIALFAATAVGAAFAWRRRHDTPRRLPSQCP